MALQFPQPVVIGERFVDSTTGRAWKWDGTSWNVDNAFTVNSIPVIPQAKILNVIQDLSTKINRYTTVSTTLSAASWALATDGVQTIEVLDASVNQLDLVDIMIDPSATLQQLNEFNNCSIVFNQCTSNGRIIVKAYQRKPTINIPIIYRRGLKKKN
jgi:hypothetical protein